MTVRAILDSKGRQIQSVEPDARLSAAIKVLSERKIGAVLVMSKGRSKASCRNATSCACSASAVRSCSTSPSAR